MFDQIKRDLVDTMKSGDKFKLGVIRMLKSALQNEEITLGGNGSGLTDDQVLTVIKREVKKRNSSIEEYNKYGKEEMVQIIALAYARTHTYIRTWVCTHRREYRRNPEISSEYLNIPKEYFNIGGIFKYRSDNKIFEAWNGRENPNQASFIENQIKELSISNYERAFW